MPTTLERTTLTHTPQVQHLLDSARSRWPDERPAVLLMNLAQLGASQIEADDRDAARRAREAQLDAFAAQTRDAYGHAYTDSYLDEVREGW